MSLEKALAGRLLADATIAGFGLTTDRIRLGKSKQNQKGKRIVLMRVSGRSVRDWDGQKIKTARTQIDCYDDTHAGMTALHEAVSDSLDGFKGLLDSTYQIDQIQLDNETDLSEFDGDDTDRHMSLDFLTTYQTGV